VFATSEMRPATVGDWMNGECFRKSIQLIS
jgi:hypothetical protein